MNDNLQALYNDRRSAGISEKSEGEIEREVRSLSQLTDVLLAQHSELRSRVNPVCRRPRPTPAPIGQSGQSAITESTESDLGDSLREIRNNLNRLSDNIRETINSITL